MPPDILFAKPLEPFLMRWVDLGAGWLLTYLVHSTLLLLAAWLITSRTRVSVVARDVVWKCALVGGIVTASIQMGVAREPLGGQLSLTPRTHSSLPTMRVSVNDDMGKPARVFVTEQRGTRWTAGLIVLWLTSSGIGLLWLTIGHARSLDAMGDRAPLDGTPIDIRLRALLHRARVDRAIELTASATLASPVALAGNEICLPRRALLELEPNEQDSMLAHEVAHLVRRDPHWLIVARAIEVVLFVQPLNRLARHRMQEVAEYLCDDWAVSRMGKPVTLAKCLAAVAEWVGRAPRGPRLQPMSAMVEAGGSPLVRRVGRILNGESKSHAGSARMAVGASACALIALVGVAPRVSVASNVLRGGTMTFINTVTAAGRVRVGGDSMIVFRTGRAPAELEAMMRAPRGAAVGPVGVSANARVVRPSVILVERPLRIRTR
ncbi:MAG TPA: M56 family metallopeptidase [Gemmatimonadaceae bacterium]|nr:M56 family metallopeptidase [Gemmatimonadaceae bacterium]